MAEPPCPPLFVWHQTRTHYSSLSSLSFWSKPNPYPWWNLIFVLRFVSLSLSLRSCVVFCVCCNMWTLHNLWAFHWFVLVLISNNLICSCLEFYLLHSYSFIFNIKPLWLSPINLFSIRRRHEATNKHCPPKQTSPIWKIHNQIHQDLFPQNPKILEFPPIRGNLKEHSISNPSFRLNLSFIKLSIQSTTRELSPRNPRAWQPNLIQENSELWMLQVKL